MTTPTTKLIVIDGATVTMCDAGIALVNALKKQLQDAETAHGTALATALAEKDKQIGTLTAELGAAKALVLTDAQIEAKAAERAELVTLAKALHDADYTGKSADEIRAAVVHAKLGDSAKDMSAASISGAFAVLAAGAAGASTAIDPLAASLRDSKPAAQTRGYLADGKSAAQTDREKAMSEAWRGK